MTSSPLAATASAYDSFGFDDVGFGESTATDLSGTEHELHDRDLNSPQSAQGHEGLGSGLVGRQVSAESTYEGFGSVVDSPDLDAKVDAEPGDGACSTVTPAPSDLTLNDGDERDAMAVSRQTALEWKALHNASPRASAASSVDANLDADVEAPLVARLDSDAIVDDLFGSIYQEDSGNTQSPGVGLGDGT